MIPYREIPRWVFLPALVGLAVVVVPLVGLLPKVEWSTFISDIREPATASALALSAKSALLAVLICVILGVPLAIVIARAPARLATFLRTIVTLPLVLPPLVGGVALLSILGRNGIIGPLLERVGVFIPFTPAAVVVAQTFVAMPFLVISVESALRALGSDYERVAASLGSSRTRTLTFITLPLIGPGLIAGIVLAFARSVGEFGATALLAGNKPGVTQTIPMSIYTAFNGVGTSRDAAMALSVLLIATALIILLFFPAARGASTEHSSRAVRRRVARTSPPARSISDDAARLAADRPAHSVPLGVDVDFSRGHFDLEAKLDVAPGQSVAIVGPNAAGKSTLLGLIAGHLVPARGAITVGDRSFGAGRGDQGPRGRNIGLLSQRPLLFPHMSVLNNVAFGPISRGVDRATAHQRARELLASVGVEGSEYRRPFELSGGQQQRVSLARALATEPDVLLLDEPLAAMDVSVAPSIRSLIAEQIKAQKLTTVTVTHDLMDVITLAERVVVVEDGRITEDANVEDFIHSPQSAFGSALTGLNVLQTASGDLVHARETELEIVPKTDGRWRGTIDRIDVAGGVARVQLTVDGRPVTVASEVAAVTSLHPGSQVSLALRDRMPAA